MLRFALVAGARNGFGSARSLLGAGATDALSGGVAELATTGAATTGAGAAAAATASGLP